MKKIIVLGLLISLFWSGLTAQGQNTTVPPCAGAVIAVPAGGLGLPVMREHSYVSGYVRSLPLNTPVTVSATWTSTAVGDTWFRMADGWIQAKSGYTTYTVSVTLGDFYCAQALPHGVD